MAAGIGAAVQRARRSPRHGREQRRRDRPRPDTGGHLDVGAVEHQGQYDTGEPHGEEQTTHANERLRALNDSYKYGLSTSDDRRPGSAPADSGFLSFNAQADDTIDFSLNDAHSFDNTFSWFVPDKMGRHEAKFGFRTHSWISNPNNARANGVQFSDRSAVQPRRSADLSRAVQHPSAGPARLRAEREHL